LPGHRLQAGEEEIADGECARLAAGQDAPDVVDELFIAVVDDVVGHQDFPFKFLLTIVPICDKT